MQDQNLSELFKRLKRQKGGDFCTGPEAIRRSGIPSEFIEQTEKLMGSSGVEASYIAFRVSKILPSGDQRPQRPQTPRKQAPKTAKPRIVKSKTSNHGLVSDFIPIDPALTKREQGRTLALHSDDVKRLKLSDNNKNKQHTIQLSLTLRDILEKTGPEGDLKIAGYNSKTKVLTLKYKEGQEPIRYDKTQVREKREIPFVGQFRINLNEGATIQERNEHQQDESTVLQPEDLSSMTRAKFSELLDKDFPISYTKSSKKNAVFQPLEVFAKDNRPITADVDLFMIGLPPTISNLNPRAGKLFRTINENGPVIEQQKDLLKETVILFKALHTAALKKSEEALELTSLESFLINNKQNDLDTFLKADLFENVGGITPFEFLMSRLFNHVYNTELDPSIRNLVQHGPECDNYVSPPNLKGHVLHMIDGNPYLIPCSWTAELYLHDGFLEKHPVTINHTWPMKEFSSVVLQQGFLQKRIGGQYIRQETLDSAGDYYMLEVAALEIKDARELTRNVFEAIERQIEIFQEVPPVLLSLFLKEVRQTAKNLDWEDVTASSKFSKIQKQIQICKNIPDAVRTHYLLELKNFSEKQRLLIQFLKEEIIPRAKTVALSSTFSKTEKQRKISKIQKQIQDYKNMPESVRARYLQELGSLAENLNLQEQESLAKNLNERTMTLKRAITLGYAFEQVQKKEGSAEGSELPTRPSPTRSSR